MAKSINRQISGDLAALSKEREDDAQVLVLRRIWLDCEESAMRLTRLIRRRPQGAQ